jgi:hypothetical protein
MTAKGADHLSKKTSTTTTNTLTFRKDHPKDRASYGIAGLAGIVVFDKRLFANVKAPKTITVDCDLAVPEEAPAKPATKGKAAAAQA